MTNAREELRAKLRDHGLRATSVRIAVLLCLKEHGGPLTHEQLMQQLEGGQDKATVWRVLADLAEKGILRRMDLGDRVWRYELLGSHAVTADHAHFLCESCGDVRCLPPLEVRSPDGGLPESLRGAHVRLRLTGTCADCVPSDQALG